MPLLGDRSRDANSYISFLQGSLDSRTQDVWNDVCSDAA